MPESISPDFELARQKRAEVPILVQMGEKSRWTVPSDGKRFTDHYPLATLKTYRRSALCPFVEETELWSRDIHEFYAKHERK